MNSKKRRQYSAKFIRESRKFENKYYPVIYKLLAARVKKFIEDIKANGIVAARNKLNHDIYHNEFTKPLEQLHKEVSLYYAEQTYRGLTGFSKRFIKRVQKDTAGFGFNFEWSNSIVDYLRQYLLVKSVVPITNTTKKQLLQVLEDGEANGWSVERIITELENTDTLVGWRARRIVRTELGIAANYGRQLAAESFDFETEKEWIAANDHRTRTSHRKMDGETVDTDGVFYVPVIKKKVMVGLEQMNGPGDPAGSPENLINCRCTLAYVPKRDKKGNLIEKPKKLLR